MYTTSGKKKYRSYYQILLGNYTLLSLTIYDEIIIIDHQVILLSWSWKDYNLKFVLIGGEPFIGKLIVKIYPLQEYLNVPRDLPLLCEEVIYINIM
jgi:hypothetical protein